MKEGVLGVPGTAAQAALPLALRQPAKLTAHSRKSYLQLLRGEPVRQRLLASLWALNQGVPPPVPA